MKTLDKSPTEDQQPAHESSAVQAQMAVSPVSMVRLQRTLGNQAILRYLQRKPECSCGGSCDSCKHKAAQTDELKVGPTDDHHEHEAEQTAERVMRATVKTGTVLQRKCSQCEEDEEETHKLQRQDTGAGPGSAPPVVHEVLNSPGRPMDGGLRSFMEPRFGHDFSGVRIHTDSRAAESARSVNALAYTVGRDIVFAGGQYAPESPNGKRLLAHELTHVVQQNQAGGAGSMAAKSTFISPPMIASAHSPAEREADLLAHRVMSGHSVAGRKMAAPAGEMHRSVSISPTDPAAVLLLTALTHLTGRQATATGGTLALGAAVPGAARSSATVTDYVQRAISSARVYTLQSGATTPGGTAVRGVRVEAATSGTGVTITVNTSDVGEFTWTADELVSEGFVNAVSANDRTSATFPAAPATVVPGTATAPAPTNMDDLLASQLPFANATVRNRAMDLIKQRVPAVATDISLEIDVDAALRTANGVTLAEIVRGLETNTPFRVTQSITGDRVDALYMDLRQTQGAADPQRIPRRTVTFLAGAGRATPAGAPVAGGTSCDPTALREITNHLANARSAVTNTITLLNSTANLDAPLRAHFGPSGPASRARIAANYRLILSELTLDRHGWICNPRGSGSGCNVANVTGVTGPGLPLVQFCTETAAPFIPRMTTVLHEVAHSSGIGSLTVGSEMYFWQPGYPGSDGLHNADSYAQFPAAAAAAAATVTPPSSSSSGSSGTTTPPVLQRAPNHGTESMHHEIAEEYRRSHGLSAGGRDQFGRMGPTDAEIVYGGLSFPLELSTLATITPWDLAHTPPERLHAPAGSTPPTTSPTYDDYLRAWQMVRFLHNLKNLSYDYETDQRTVGRDPTPAELAVLDRNFSQVLSTFNVRGLVTGAGGRGLPTAPGGTTASLEGRAKFVDSLGDFGGKFYHLQRLVGADRFGDVPAAESERQVRAMWADPALGMTVPASARITDVEKVAVVWFQGVQMAFLQPAFYHPGDDKFYLSSHVNLNTLEGEDVVRHESVHLLGGRETTRHAFVTRFGADWMKYWRPFEEGMAELVNSASRTPAQIPPSATGSGSLSSGYTQYYNKVQRLIALPGVGRDAVMQAYFTGQISATMFQRWQQIVDTPP
jgi:hypothetical protein